ncbi:ankyrin repeat domain-containing protein [Vibrio lentus]
MSDVRNITNVDNRFGCAFEAKLYNQESAIETFPIEPDVAIVPAGTDQATGGMWTPWCDSQQDLDEGHYVQVTFSQRGHADIVNYLIQHGADVYVIDSSKQFSNKKVIAGDAASGKGNYKLEIHESNGVPYMVFNKY